MPTKTFDYEKAVKKLEDIVEKFESGEFDSLDQSVKLFKEGMELASKCKKHLNEVENTITVLKEEFDKDDLKQQSFDLEKED